MLKKIIHVIYEFNNCGNLYEGTSEAITLNKWY
jgi:hypothetical protein